VSEKILNGTSAQY